MGEKTTRKNEPCPYEAGPNATSRNSTVFPTECIHCGKRHRKNVDSSGTPQPNIKRIQNF